VTFEIRYSNQAKELTEYTLQNFSDPNHALLYFVSAKDTPLITRSKEIQDNVIPASNSQMAINLFFLGHYFDKEEWLNKSEVLVMSMNASLSAYGSGFSNWILLWLYQSQPLRELVICVADALQKRQEIWSQDLPSGIIPGGSIDSENISMTQGRLKKDQTLIYFCVDKQCHLPVSDVSEALSLLNL
jgi:hypothetical protein